MNNIVIDTNVLIYALNQDSEYCAGAKSILSDPSKKLFITTKSISEFFAVTSKFNFEKSVVLGFYNDLKNNTTFLYPTSESLTHFEELLHKYSPVGNRVFDLEIVSVMLANDISTIATFNKKDFQGIKEVEIISF